MAWRHYGKLVLLAGCIGTMGCAYPMGGTYHPPHNTMGPTTGYAPVGQSTMNGPVATLPGTATAFVPLNTMPGLASTAVRQPEITYFNVRPGDSVTSVATLYGIPEEELRKSNNLKPGDNLAPGQLVRIPDGNTAIR